MASLDSQPAEMCSRCLQMKVLYGSSGLCRLCYGIRSRNLRNSKAKQVKVPCSICGKVRSSHLLGQAICQACWLAQRNGRSLCKGCSKVKVIYCREQSLCQHCYQDQCAPERLQQYVEQFSTPYPYNAFLFSLLTSHIRWDHVRTRTLNQIRSFGRFLQTQPLRNPLTWEVIEELLARLGSTKRPSGLYFRTCLLDLGHLLAAQGLLESHEIYAARRRAMLPISRAPAQIQSLLYRYAADLWNRGAAPNDVRKHMDVLVTFWVWCQAYGVRSPEVVSASLIKEYLITLSWQWECSVCKQQVSCETPAGKAPQQCPQCGSLSALSKRKRYSHHTVRLYRSKLWAFFDWAKVNRLVMANPVLGPSIAPTQQIQCYSPDVIRKLCNYLATPDADPVEAFVLYLILFHALSTWELRHALMPDLPLVNEKGQQQSLAEAYYVQVARPPASRGKHAPGRIRLRQHFPEAAASWLKPLLERFEQVRQSLLQNSKNPYLLLAQGLAHHYAPVSEGVVTAIVQRASLRILGTVCFPSILRKTVATLFADRSGPGVLHFLGWGHQQAYAYAWATRKVVQPQADAGCQPTQKAGK